MKKGWYKKAKQKWFRERVKSASFRYKNFTIANFETEIGFLRSLNLWEFIPYFNMDELEILTNFFKKQNRFCDNCSTFFNLRKATIKNKSFWLDVEKTRNKRKFTLEEKRILKKVGLIE